MATLVCDPPTDAREFVPNAVYIPKEAFWSDSDGGHVDAEKCNLLMIGGDGGYGEVYSKEAFEGAQQPTFLLRDHDWFHLPRGLDGEEVPLLEMESDHIFGGHTGAFMHEGGCVTLLPDMWIVKIADDLGDWCPEIREQVNAIWSVYAFDRMKRVHMCEFTPSHELTFIEHQYDAKPEIRDDDYKSNDLNEEMLRADSDMYRDNAVSTYHCSDVDKMLETLIQCGFWPEAGKSGGYRFREDGEPWTHVIEKDGLAEVWEVQRGSSI